jgi:hypothetical protein
MKNFFVKPDQMANSGNVKKIELVSIQKNISQKYTHKLSLQNTELHSYPDIPTLVKNTNHLPQYFEFLYNLTSPLPVVFILQDDHQVIINQNDFKDFTDQVSLGRLTVFDCRQENYVDVIVPGVINFDELNKVLPIDFNLQYDISSELELDDFCLVHTTDTVALGEFKVVIGTKEQIKSIIPRRLPEYFIETVIDDMYVINLGSQTSLKNVAKNLKNRIGLATKIPGKKAILSQQWGHSYWANYIQNTLKYFPSIEHIKSRMDFVHSDELGTDLTIPIDTFATPLLA